jgi:hypothetical protein
MHAEIHTRTRPGFTRLRRRSASALIRIAATAATTLFIPAACATVDTAVVAEPGATFSLPVGRTAVVSGHSARITFNRVTSDSRCPIDVVCVWAGDAPIELTVSRDGSTETRTLSLIAPKNEVVVGDVRIRFVGLTPAPKQSEPPATRAYVAQLVVTPI